MPYRGATTLASSPQLLKGPWTECRGGSPVSGLGYLESGATVEGECQSHAPTLQFLIQRQDLVLMINPRVLGSHGQLQVCIFGASTSLLLLHHL